MSPYQDSINQKRAEATEKQEKQASIDAIEDLSKSIKTLLDSLETTGVKKLDKEYIQSVKRLETVLSAISTVKVTSDQDIKKALRVLAVALTNLDVKPTVNVAPTKVTVNERKIDFTPVIKALDKIKQSAPVVNVDIGTLDESIKDVKKAISSLTFPTANFILPFKDPTTGKATQVTLSTDGKLPVEATIDTAGLATSAKQDTIIGHIDGVEGLLTTIDADTGTIATEVAGLLTDTELRATPVPVSGTVTATPTGTQNVDVTANSVGLATGAKQDTGNTSLASLDTKLPAQGQALAAASTPVVLPAAQITTLTPPAAITGFATSAKQDTLLAELQLKADLTETQPVSLASVPSHAVTNAGTFAVQSANQTGDNTIGRVKLTDGTDVADILDLTNSNPLTTAIVDANGDQITSFGGGTQYTEDAAAAANPVGTALNLVRDDARGGSLTTTDGDNVAARGNNKGELYVKSTDSDALLTTIDADTSNISTKLDTVAGAVSGTEMQVDVVTSALPSGAATSAKQDTIIGHVDGLETSNSAIQTSVQLLDDTVATLGTDTYTEAATKGLTIGAVRRDANTTLVNTTNEVAPLQVNATGELKVAQIQALPAGTNNIGDVDIASIAAGDNNIGNVDIVTVPADPFGANADAAATAGGTGSIQAKLRNLTSTNDSIKTAVETIDNAISGNEMQVDVVAALPAGTNAIGKLSANSGVDIGDVDVTSAVSATMDHGSNRDIDTAAEQITATSFACKFGVTLRADDTNTGILYIGNSDVTAGTTAATDGFPLAAGESITLPVTNSNIPYAIASANNQIIYWVAV